MNGIAKAGGILMIIASAFGIIGSLFLIFFGWLLSSVDSEGIGAIMVIAGIIVIVLSVLLITWSIAYMRDGSKKILLGVIAIIAAIFSGGILGFILYVLAAIFVFVGKEAV